MRRITVAEWGAAEYGALLRAVALGKLNQGSETEELRARLRASYGGRPLLFINRGRYALDLALRAFAEQRPGKTEIIFPGYICPSVIEAIEHAGLVPVAADIGADLNIDPGEVKSHISTRTLAVIVAHMYGCPAKLEEIEALCRPYDIFVVDDAAQLGGVTSSGRAAGSFGTCGLVSFSLSKTIVTGSANAGAFLIVNDPRFEAILGRTWDGLPEAQYSVRDTLQFLADGPFYAEFSAISYRLQRLRELLPGRQPAPALRDWTPRRMANANAVVALKQLDSVATRIAGRTRVAAAFHDRIADSGMAEMPQFAPGRYLTRIMVRVHPHIAVPSLRSALAARGVQTRLAYPTDGRYGQRASRAASAAEQLIELPSHSRIDTAGISQIVATLTRTANAMNEPALPLRTESPG